MSVRSALPVFALGILASSMAVRNAAAATSSASISVTATVQASCLVSTTVTAFRIYAAPAEAASAVSVSCSNASSSTVTISTTSAPAATRGLRETVDSRFILLRYALIPNSRGIANWGQALGNSTSAVFGSGFAQELAILGRLSAAQRAKSGASPDTMIVVVTY